MSEKKKIRWDIPTIADKKIYIDQQPGECLFIVGANGSGKSALIQKFVSDLIRKKIDFERYSAYRQSWIPNPVVWQGVDIDDARLAMINRDQTRMARWMDQGSDEIRYGYMFESLINQKKAHDINIKQLIDSGKTPEAEVLRETDPLVALNKLLKQGNLSVRLEYDPGTDGLISRHIDNEVDVDIRALSDGERALIIFATTVMTMPISSVLLIDEPDLRLHPSILAPFFEALVKSRKDCFFVFSTHNLSFPPVFPDAKIVAVRSCTWIQDSAFRFDAHLIAQPSIPEYVRQDILGARTQVLYVEGTEKSLDSRLYRVLFPGCSIIPKTGNSSVVKSVKGLRESPDVHHVEAWGLIDKDLNDSDEIDGYLKKNIGVLDVYSIESLYYSKEAIMAVAGYRQSVQSLRQALGSLDEKMTDAAIDKACKILKQKKVSEDIAEWRATLEMRKNLKRQANKVAPLSDTKSVTIEAEYLYESELNEFLSLVDVKDWNTLLRYYPIHRSDAFNTIAKSFRLSKHNYENLVVYLAQKDERLANSLRSCISMPRGFQ